MINKSQLIISVLLVLLVVSTLCIEEKNNKPNPPEKWWDLERFNTFLEENFTVTEKEKSGSKLIQNIDEPENTLYIAVGIDEPFTNLEAESIHNFVKSGGNIIVASDNSENVNVLSKLFGVTYINHAIIYKFEEIDYNYTFLPVSVATRNNSFSIIMHSPLGLELTESNIEVLAASISSPNQILSALDINDNIKIDGEDKPGPIPVIVEVTVNNGKAIFISDAGMFTDNLWKLVSKDSDFKGRIYQNEEFIVDLVYEKSTLGGEIIYDTSKQKAGFSNFHPYPVN